MASQEEVYWLYRCLFNRAPEDEATVRAQMAHPFEALRAAMMSSREFEILIEHDSETRYVAPDTKEARLALACIVKNEASSIESMLRSCLELVEFISIVDTGSEDDTVRRTIEFLTKEIPGRHSISEIDFHDFASARNKAIASVPLHYDWILMLDADEHLVAEDIDRFRALLQADVDAWHLPRLNFVDAAKALPARPYPDHQCRLFRNRGDIRFVGRVHERLVGPRSEAFAPANREAARIIGGPHIHHMGQVGLTHEAWQRKHDFYTRLAETDGNK